MFMFISFFLSFLSTTVQSIPLTLFFFSPLPSFPPLLFSHRRLDLLVHEILLKQGKGQSSPSSSSSTSASLPLSRPPSFDIKTRGGRGQERPTWSLHMPALKAVYVQEMDARGEAYALLG